MSTRALAALCVLLTALPAHAYLEDYDTKPVPSAERPALDTPLVDPTFGATITRRTDPGGAKGLRHEYGKYAPANADNTLVVVQELGGPESGKYEIRRLDTHALIATLPVSGDPEASWHPTDPDRLRYRAANELREWRVSAGQYTVVMQFTDYETVGTHEEGRPSEDWLYWAAIGTTRGGRRDLIVADLTAKTVIATLRNVGGALDWVSMSMTGEYVVAMYTDSRGTRVYSRALALTRTLIADHTHADLARDGAGDDILVYLAVTGKQLTELGCPNAPGGAPIASARLRDGMRRILLGDCYTSDWQQAVVGTFVGWWFDAHFSGIISRARPGWVLVSTYAGPTDPQEPMTREIFFLKTDGSGEVARLAHHQSQVATVNGERDYWAEPHAASSWDGRLVFYASTWGETGKHYDLYTVSQTAEPPATLTDDGTYRCRWVWQRQADGSLTGFRAECAREGERHGQ